jgi:hypothetical protein
VTVTDQIGQFLARQYSAGPGSFAAADRRAAEGDVAAAPLLEATVEAIATGLQHVAAPFIARGAGDAAAVLGEFALDGSPAEEDLATGDAILRATTGAKPVARQVAKFLQRRAVGLILATAMDLEAPFAFLEPHHTAWHHHHAIAWGVLRRHAAKGFSGLGGETTCRETLEHHRL